jgi:hypothetical protein
MTDTRTDPAPDPQLPTGAPPAVPERHGSLALGAIAGLAAAVAGAAAWAAFTYATDYELGLVAVALGALVGLAVRTAGKGRDVRFAALGAVLAAFGCGLGILLSYDASLAKMARQPLLDVVQLLGVEGSVQLASDVGGPMDLLFVAIAVWEGWKLSVLPAARETEA